jgi:hypothetical protein
VPVSSTTQASCRATAASLCARFETCAAPLMAYAFGSSAQCETEVARTCESDYEGSSANDAAPCDATGVSCSAMLQTVLEGGEEDSVPALPPITHAASLGTWLGAFCPVTAGRATTGEPCLRHGDCASGLCIGSGAACGRCSPTLREGDPCSSLRGGRCSATLVCARGHCVPDLPPPRSLAPEGAPCHGSYDCDFFAGLVCDATLRCRPIVLGGAGAGCTGDVPFYPEGTRACDGFHRCSGGICVTIARPLLSSPTSCRVE